MKRLAGILFGLGVLMPTLHYETGLFERVSAALDGDEVAVADLRPPIDVDAALEKFASIFD